MRKRIAAVAALAIAAMAAMALAGCAQQAASTNANAAAEPEKATLAIEVRAEGYDKESSSPFVAHVTGEGTDAYIAFNANERHEAELPAGAYDVEVTVPAVNADGSTYAIGAGTEGSKVHVDLGGGAKPDEQAGAAGIRGGDAVTGEVAPVAAADAPAERRAAIAEEAARAAAANRDLAGIAERCVANLKAALTEEEAEELEEAAEEARAQAEAQQPSSGNGSGSGSAPSAPSQGGAPEGGSGSGSGGGSAPSQPSQPAHEHSWTYHEAVYAPQQVVVGEYVQCSCGAQFSSQPAWSAHNQSLGWGVSHSYSVKPLYETQQVCVRDAYYSCACGATM